MVMVARVDVAIVSSTSGAAVATAVERAHGLEVPVVVVTGVSKDLSDQEHRDSDVPVVRVGCHTGFAKA